MENTLTIIITAGITLVVTVLAGIIIEYIKKRKAKLLYLIQTSIPIEQDNNHIGANTVYIENHSSKTVKNIIVKLITPTGTIKNAGIKTTTGLDYQVKEEDKYLTIDIPFLKSKEHISITTILEGQYSIPDKPDLTVRSPDAFILENLENSKNNGFKLSWISSLVIPILAVGSILWIFFTFISPRSDQSTNLELAASFVGLPNIAKNYITGKGTTYYNQAPYIYSLAKESNDKNKIEKYKQFLIKVIEIVDNISPHSKSAICFFIGKINQLQNNEKKAKEWFEKSNDISDKEYLFLKNMFSISISNKT